MVHSRPGSLISKNIRSLTLVEQGPISLASYSDCHIFHSHIGHSLDKSNQIESIKHLSANLQNMFRLNSTKTGFNFRYFSEKSFNTRTSKLEENTSLSVFTWNIRSFNRNSDVLNTLRRQLTCLTEIWNSNLTFMGKIFRGYKCKNVPQKSSKCGSVDLFYRQNYKF